MIAARRTELNWARSDFTVTVRSPFRRLTLDACHTGSTSATCFSGTARPGPTLVPPDPVRISMSPVASMLPLMVRPSPPLFRAETFAPGTGPPIVMPPPSTRISISPVSA